MKLFINPRIIERPDDLSSVIVNTATQLRHGRNLLLRIELGRVQAIEYQRITLPFSHRHRLHIEMENGVLRFRHRRPPVGGASFCPRRHQFDFTGPIIESNGVVIKVVTSAINTIMENSVGEMIL